VWTGFIWPRIGISGLFCKQGELVSGPKIPEYEAEINTFNHYDEFQFLMMEAEIITETYFHFFSTLIAPTRLYYTTSLCKSDQCQ
jgi:hypothetical protein